jgi:hypothetical protein
MHDAVIGDTALLGSWVFMTASHWGASEFEPSRRSMLQDRVFAESELISLSCACVLIMLIMLIMLAPGLAVLTPNSHCSTFQLMRPPSSGTCTQCPLHVRLSPVVTQQHKLTMLRLQNPAAACMPGNSAGYGNIDEGIQDIVARLEPHPTQAGSCRWTTALQLAPGPKFRDSDYIDMVSMRGAGASNYGAGTRMFFKGQQVYNNVLPGPASCDDTVRA